MISRNRRIRLRVYLGLFAFCAGTVLIAVTAFSWRCLENHRLSQRAKALLQEITDRHPGLGSPEMTDGVSISAPLPDSASVDKHVLDELPPVARVLMDAMLAAAPWFEQDTLTKAADTLERCRAADANHSLSPLEQSLDPATHSSDELHATLCAMVRDSGAVAGLRQGVREGHALALVEPAASWTVRMALRTCAACALADGRADLAADAYIDAYLSMLDTDTEAEQGRVHTTGNAFDRRRMLDGRLAELMDAFPGAVPKDMADRLSAALEQSDQPDRFKDCLRLDAAAAVVHYEELRKSDLDKVWKNGFLTQCFMPSVENPLYLMAGRNPAYHLMPAVEQALPLLETPPHAARNQLWALANAVPETASATRNFIQYMTIQSWYHYHHRAMTGLTRTVLALKQYKTEKGGYPPVLDGITPSLPADPFTGGALAYAIDGEGFTITPPTATGEVSQVERSLQPRWRAAR